MSDPRLAARPPATSQAPSTSSIGSQSGEEWLSAPPPAPMAVTALNPEPARAAEPAPVPARVGGMSLAPATAVLEVPRESAPADWGWRARVRQFSAGVVRPGPGEAESMHRQAVTTIRQATWTRSVNVMVTNPKGGTAKTPTSLLLAGILGSYRGGYVVAWEASESVGSLTARAEGRPTRGLAELVAGVERITSAGNLGGYTAPQTSHSDVIGSVGDRPVLSADEMLSVREVLDTYYRITVTDTGNNPGHETYQAALATADAVVIPCLVSIDALAGVEQALNAIERAQSTAGTGLRERVVVVLGHDGGPEDSRVSAGVRRQLGECGVTAVVEVPFDPVIRLGGEISLSRLSRPSISAWTAAGAAVVTALRDVDTDADLVARVRKTLSAG